MYQLHEGNSCAVYAQFFVSLCTLSYIVCIYAVELVVILKFHRKVRKNLAMKNAYRTQYRGCQQGD
jgi:hypothetical protein